ncbi:MAG: LacI family transcriptional regulator [Propionibacteriaceae bacterium]|nr:LacI family transcriptional regulator [Propionibacteriaceae bacterium]
MSHQTVSRVLNNHPAVSPRTRQKVQEAIATLGYRRNMAAHMLATGSSNLIGIMSSSDLPAGRSSPVFALEHAARAAGYWVLIASVGDDNPHEAAAAIRHFQDCGVMSTVAIARTDAALSATLTALGDASTVLIMPERLSHGHPCVSFDQAEGVRDAMTLLRGLGHTRIAHIRGPEGALQADERARVWASMLSGGQSADDLCVTGNWFAESGYRAAMQLLALDEPPTAIFAANDQMALGALRAISERGLRVPHDISVVGFDNMDGSNCSIPPLTTVAQDMDALGAAAFELICEGIRQMPPRAITLPAQLIIRASTGAAPRR